MSIAALRCQETNLASCSLTVTDYAFSEDGAGAQELLQ